MEVIICPHADAAVAFTARLTACRVAARPDMTLGLATGRTMEAVYARLASSGVSFSACTTFNLDEYIGLPASDRNSYRSYMQKHFFDRVDIDPSRTHLPDGMSEDVKAEAARYEALIRQSGGIALQLLGIGETGHIGFNEPGSSLCSRTRDKVLTPLTRQQNAGMFGGDPDRVPKRALTMGVGTILDAEEIILLATGPKKAAMVASAIEGCVTSMVIASALQLHPACIAVLDEAAASQLSAREYYDFIFHNDPEWDGWREFS